MSVARRILIGGLAVEVEKMKCDLAETDKEELASRQAGNCRIQAREFGGRSREDEVLTLGSKRKLSADKELAKSWMAVAPPKRQSERSHRGSELRVGERS